MRKTVILQLNKTIHAHDSVLTEMAVLQERNEELRQLRDSLTEGHEDQTQIMTANRQVQQQSMQNRQN